jgi:signal transduction histidine kinase
MPWKRLLYLIPAAVSLATAVLAVVCLVEGRSQFDRVFPGFFFHANGTVASMQRGGWEGPAIGLRPGDVVLAANGARVRDGAALNRWLAQRREGELVAFTLERPRTGESLVVQLRLRRLNTLDILATFVLPYGIGVVYLLLGAVVFFLRRSYEGALAMSICVVASVFYMTTFDAHTSHHLARLWASYCLLGPVSVHLVAVFPARRRLHRHWFLIIVYVIAAAIVTFGQIVLHRAAYARHASVLATTFLASCFVATMLILGRTERKDPSEVIRNKAKTIRIGLLITAAVGVVWSLVVRFQPELITAERAMMFSALLPILLGYAVIKKNLFDADIFLRTTTIYVIATALVALLYFAVVFGLGLAMSAWTRRYTGLLQNVEAAVISTLIVALIFHPVRIGVQRVVDRFFFRVKGQLQESLNQLGKDLAAMTPNLAALAQRLTEQVQTLMRCRYVVLLSRSSPRKSFSVVAVAGAAPAPLAGLALAVDSAIVAQAAAQGEPLTLRDEGAEWLSPELGELLRAAEASALVPLRSASSLSGLMLLGPRHHGDVFTAFDMSALRTLSLPAALALENSLLLREHAERERLAALGKFSAVIIHEIKNPLGIIRVSSGTLKKRFDSSDSGYELASFIEEEVVRMNQTIGQFLSFARPSEARLVRLDLASLVRRTAAAASGELEQTGIALEMAVEDQVQVVADADQMQQVLLNLLINARQALAGRPGARIRLSLRRTRPAGMPPSAELQVADNGPGIDAAASGRIFEPFFTTRPSGTGLGLAIARQLVVGQGGQISFRSPAGEGTTFTITLPAAPAGA